MQTSSTKATCTRNCKHKGHRGKHQRTQRRDVDEALCSKKGLTTLKSKHIALSTSHLCVLSAFHGVLCAEKCRSVILLEKSLKQHLRDINQSCVHTSQGMPPAYSLYWYLTPSFYKYPCWRFVVF